MANVRSNELTVTFSESPVGWFALPQGLDARASMDWVDQAVAKVKSDWGDGWDEQTQQFVAQEFADALDYREASDALAIAHVWSVKAPVTTYFSVELALSRSLPPWTELMDEDTVIHPLSIESLGEGIQISIRRRVEIGDESIELAALNAIFDDGETSVIVSLREAPLPILTKAIGGFWTALSSMSVLYSDGEPFRPVRAPGLVYPEDFEEFKDAS